MKMMVMMMMMMTMMMMITRMKTIRDDDNVDRASWALVPTKLLEPGNALA